MWLNFKIVVVTLSPPGPYLRLFRAIDRAGWFKYHTARELSQLTGFPVRRVQRMLSTLERFNLVNVRYDLDTGAKLVRMRTEVVEFTDGYIVYRYSHGIFGGVEVDIPDEIPHNRKP